MGFNAVAYALNEALSNLTNIENTTSDIGGAVYENNVTINASIISNSSKEMNDSDISSNGTTIDPAVNTTDKYFEHIKQPLIMLVILSVSYSLVFFLALFGNFSVVLAVARDKSLHTATNLFLVNMAVADMLMAIFCLPITLMANIFTGWQFGAFMCRATPYLQGVAVCASANTLVVIAVDRYFAICHVMRQRNTKRMAKVILIIIWLLALLLMMPWVLYYRLIKYEGTVQIIDVCIELFPEPIYQKVFFLVVIFLMCYAIPLIVIVVCYSLIGYRVWNRDAPGITSSRGVIEKSKVRVIKMLVVVVFLFTFSWMPLYIIRLIILYGDVDGDQQKVIYEVAVPFAQWLGTSNSCMNPLVYCLFSQKIRSRIRAMFCCTKPELRSVYSSRSMCNSAFQQTASLKDSTIKANAFTNGFSRYGHYQVARMNNHEDSPRPASHRSSRFESEVVRLQRNKNERSTHV